MPVASQSLPAVPARPPILRVAGLLVWLEAAVLVGLGVFFVVEVLVAESFDELGAWLIALICVGCGLALGLVARGLLAVRAWSRSPALVTQIVALPVAQQLFAGGRWYLAVPTLVIALLTAFGVLSPATTRALVR